MIAANLANVGSAGTDWQPKRLMSGPRGDFAAHLGADPSRPDDGAERLLGVAVYGVETLASPPRLVHEPGNPKADSDGMVAYPAIDHAAEMTLMVGTARAYEANVVAMNTARQMYGKALELGRRS